MKKNCTIYNEKITAYLDHELSDPEKTLLETHLKACKTCGLQLESEKLARSLLNQALEGAPVPEELCVEQIILKPRKSFRSILRNPQIQAIAATLLILLSLGLWFTHQKVGSALSPADHIAKKQTIRYGPAEFIVSLQTIEKENIPRRYAQFCKATSNTQQVKTGVDSLLNNYTPQSSKLLHSTRAGDYDQIVENSFKPVSRNPLSTFAMNVDTASYGTIQRCLSENRQPQPESVRIEELVNYFNYDYPKPKKNESFSLSLEASECPWNPRHTLVLVGIQTKAVNYSKSPPNNLLFLINRSESMHQPLRLPLLKAAMRRMVKDLRPQDQIGILSFDKELRTVLAPTSNKQKIIAALDQLQNGEKIKNETPASAAYRFVKQHRIKNGNNCIILATDNPPESSFLQTVKINRKEKISVRVLDFSNQKSATSKLERLAHQTKGNHAQISSILDARKALVSAMGGTFRTVAEKVKIQVEFNPLHVKEYRLIGYENQHKSVDNLADGFLNAGSLGAGHTVTALYELVPVDSPLTFISKTPQSNLLPYAELMSVNLQYKRPKSKKIHHLIRSIKRSDVATSHPSNNLRFTRAVAEFGLLMKNSKYKAAANFEHVLHDAQKAQGTDKDGQRNHFIQLVKKAQTATP